MLEKFSINICLNLCHIRPSFLIVLISPRANPINILIPTSTRSFPVLSTTSSTWSSQGMVVTLSFPSNSWIDPSVAQAKWLDRNFCWNILKAFNIIEAVSLLAWFDETWEAYKYLLLSGSWWWLCWNLLSWWPYLCCSNLSKHLDILVLEPVTC